MARLPLPDDARTTVYTMIVDALKRDPVLKRVFQPSSWMTYTGESPNTVPFGSGAYPSIEVIPFSQGASSLTQVRQNSPLGIRITVTTLGTDVRDLINLWGAVEAAVFTGDGSRVLNNSIRATLAAKGKGASLTTIRLTDPGITPGKDATGNQVMTGVGMLSAEMTVPR